MKNYFVSLCHAYEASNTNFRKVFKGLRFGDLWSFLISSFAEGLSPGVTLFIICQRPVLQNLVCKKKSCELASTGGDFKQEGGLPMTVG